VVSGWHVRRAGDGFFTRRGVLIRLLDRYREESQAKTQPVLRLSQLGELIGHLDMAEFVREGGLTGEALEDFLERYLAATTRLHHPAYFAHQVSVPHYAGSLAALVDGFTNNPMAIYEMGPAATAIEYFVINWLLEKVGWMPAPEQPGERSIGSHGAGVLTHGGSLANLTALIAARTKAAPRVWKEGTPGDLAILAPAQSHYSIARAAGILGLGSNAVYALDVDERGVVIPDRLPDALHRVIDAGRRPMALVANACSTAVGLYDPLAELGAFCRERGIWFHVDGAHGSFSHGTARFFLPRRTVKQYPLFRLQRLERRASAGARHSHRGGKFLSLHHPVQRALVSAACVYESVVGDG